MMVRYGMSVDTNSKWYGCTEDVCLLNWKDHKSVNTKKSTVADEVSHEKFNEYQQLCIQYLCHAANQLYPVYI